MDTRHCWFLKALGNVELKCILQAVLFFVHSQVAEKDLLCMPPDPLFQRNHTIMYTFKQLKHVIFTPYNLVLWRSGRFRKDKGESCNHPTAWAKLEGIFVWFRWTCTGSLQKMFSPAVARRSMVFRGAAVNPESLKTTNKATGKLPCCWVPLLLGESSLILCSFLGYCSSVRECKTAVDVVSKPLNINHVTCWEILLICVVPAIHSHLKATTINIMSRLDITTADGRNPAFVEM